MINKLAQYRERLRRKLQKIRGQRLASNFENPFSSCDKLTLTTFFDVESHYAMPNESCAPIIPDILAIQAEAGITSTYNTVAKLAQDEPQMIANIVADGHEISSHSLQHEVLTQMSANAQKRDIENAIQIYRSLGVEIIGHRSPQSAWNKDLMNTLVNSGMRWSAEDGNESHPYPMHMLTGALWRFPVSDDDWGYQSEALNPQQMLDRWKLLVDHYRAAGQYLAIGFHPWVQGYDKRINVFAEFMHWIAGDKSIKVIPFGNLARELDQQQNMSKTAIG